MAVMEQATIPSGDLEHTLEQHRRELTGYCYRMLGSPFEAEDAVQETLIRAWRSFDKFEGRSAVRSWLYRIATNVCFDMLGSRTRRATPMDMGPAQEPVAENLFTLPEATWIEPIPTGRWDRVLIFFEQDEAGALNEFFRLLPEFEANH